MMPSSCHHRRRGVLLPRHAELSFLATSPLPVAGIAAPEAGAILYAVRRAFAKLGEEAPSCDLLLLAALSCAQEASDRLLANLDAAQRAAGFWRARMRAGGHDAFMLLGRGPVHFATGVFASFGGKSGRRRPNDDEEQPQSSSSATDRIQERIDALEALSRRLAAAVARVHRSADLLRLNAPPGTRGTTAAAAAAAAAPSSAAMQPAAPLASSDPDAAERAVALSLRRLRAALEDVPRAAAEAAARGERGDDNSSKEEDDNDSEGGGGGDGALPTTKEARGGGADGGPGPLEAARADLAAVVAVLDGCPLCFSPTTTTTTTQTTAQTTTAALLARLLPPSRDATDALRRAAASALSRGALAPVPPWAAMPSRLQRHWLRYAAAGAAAVALGAWARRHSRLAGGSGELERWAAETGASLSSAWRAHVVDPLAAVRRELFATLRDRPGIVSQAEFAGDREALLRMLRAFEGDHGEGPGAAVAGGAGAPAELAPAAAAAAAATTSTAAAAAADPPSPSDDRALLMSRGMSRVMESYELELRRPLRNLFAGSLARCLLIQVQRLKVDTEAAMLEMDQILRANELSLTLVAAVPSLGVAALAARGAYRLVLARAPPDPKREAVPCRMAMGALERALGAARAAARAAEAEKEEEGGARGAGAVAAVAAPALGPSPSPSPRRPRAPPPPPPSSLPAHPVPQQGGSTNATAQSADASNAEAVAAAEGAAVHALHRVLSEAARVYRLRRGYSGRVEWPHLREGLVQMARPPLSGEGKAEYHRHLARTYALFQA